MQSKLIRVLLLALLATLVATAAACGGDEESPAGDATPAVTETSGDGGADSGDEETTTQEATTETSEEEGDVSDVASADDCRELGALGSQLQEALGGASGDDTKKYAQFLREFAERTPEAIRDDFKVVAEVYSKYAELLAGLDLESGETPSPEALQKFQELSEEIDEQELQQASSNITKWVQENCRT